MDKRKIHFSMEKDIQLLAETIIHNPYSYGSDKWANVSCNLKEKYDLDVLPRTARERVNNLLMKLRKDDLSPRTATKKEIDERKGLLLQVRALMEDTDAASANSCSEDKKPRMSMPTTPISMDQEEEFFQVFVDEKDIDWPTTNQRKRPANIDEYLKIKRQEMDHELNILRLKNDNEQKIKELELQAEREKAEREYKLQSLSIERQRLEAEGENKRLLTSVIELVTLLSGKISGKTENEIMFN